LRACCQRAALRQKDQARNDGKRGYSCDARLDGNVTTVTGKAEKFAGALRALSCASAAGFGRHRWRTQH